MSSKPVYTLRFVQLEPKTNKWAEVQVPGNSKLVMIEDIVACLFAHGSLIPIHLHQYAIMNDDATIELHFARDFESDYASVLPLTLQVYGSERCNDSKRVRIKHLFDGVHTWFEFRCGKILGRGYLLDSCYMPNPTGLKFPRIVQASTETLMHIKIGKSRQFQKGTHARRHSRRPL